MVPVHTRVMGARPAQLPAPGAELRAVGGAVAHRGVGHAEHHADAAACPPTDEIGTTRPQGPACDVGAYEVPVAAVVIPPPAKPATPTIGVAGVRRACVASRFHVRFRVGTANSTVKKVVVKLDGKRIKSTARGSFTLTINGKKLKAGRHRLTITATNAAGQTKTVIRSFSVCKAAKPRQKAAPRFTG